MNKSYFGPRPAQDAESQSPRQPIGATNGRYLFFKVRLNGKLHFEKRVAPDHLADLATVEALRKEFEIGYGLDHPNIVRYLRYDDNALYEEFLDGLTLRRMIDQQDPRLADPDFVSPLCRQLLEALDYIHRHGILHLDLKPENVMVCNIGNTAKIIDLGSARTGQFDTTEGFTPTYRAPEQGSHDSTSVATDIYLLGRLMAELTRGSRLSPLWEPFLSRATAPDPARRFPSAADALGAIPAGAPAAKRPGRRLPTLGAAALIAIVLARFCSSDNAPAPQTPTPAPTPAPTTFEQARNLLIEGSPSRDEAEGMRLMMQAARQGDSDAQCYIGLAYRDGTSTLPRDPAKSLYWIQQSAEGGNEIAIEEMGMKYYEGFGVKQDYTQALKWWERAAKRGKTTAYSSIGIAYRDGLGVEPDLDRAAKNFLRGAEAGNSYCAFLLGRHYGHYLQPVQPRLAIEWYERASHMGSHRATEYLLNAYRNGDPELQIAPDSTLATKYATRLQGIDGP